MANNTTTQVNGGCGCITIILFILFMSALFFGLPTSWGTFNLDLFPPGIYLEK
jgi:hypothetical protein